MFKEIINLHLNLVTFTNNGKLHFSLINPYLANNFILYPLKTLENKGFFAVSGGSK